MSHAGKRPPQNSGSGTGNSESKSKNKVKLRCQVECYGQGKIHEDILKKLETSSCEGGPGIPCILFVYKVSHEIEDLRNALQWITKNGTTQKEDICAVFLLEKISERSEVGEVMITLPDLYHVETKAVRVLWKEIDALWKMLGSNPFSCPEAIQTVREIIRQRSSQTRQGGEEADVCADTQSVMSDAGKRPPQNSGSGTGNSESKSKNKVKLRCQVECYGQGKIHEDILKKLETSSCEGGPGIPCILFVYKVSHEIEDLRNALQWITKNETTQKEDICAVFLLEKISERSEVGEVMITLPDLYHVETKAVRVLWKEIASWKMGNPFSCPEAIETVREIIRQRNSQTRQGGEEADVCADVWTDCGSRSVMSAGDSPPGNSGLGRGVQNNSKNKEKLRCQVECYGQGKIHEDILKKLETSSCEGGPGIPCILFVYKVSREIEDLRNAQQWITKNETIQKEDICAVFLLEKISEKSKVGEEMITVPDLFHEDTKVVRVLWKEKDALWKMLVSNPFSCPEAIQTVREIIRQRNSQTRQDAAPTC
ncbi:uncharacterized protein [Heptranchias perlo]|uniref:uncharacterized protein isoform X2 n=1 Tax=Heptranchias perlo TaxID=212740 RepID=UPI003559A34E